MDGSVTGEEGAKEGDARDGCNDRGVPRLDTVLPPFRKVDVAVEFEDRVGKRRVWSGGRWGRGKRLSGRRV